MNCSKGNISVNVRKYLEEIIVLLLFDGCRPLNSWSREQPPLVELRDRIDCLRFLDKTSNPILHNYLFSSSMLLTFSWPEFGWLINWILVDFFYYLHRKRESLTYCLQDHIGMIGAANCPLRSILVAIWLDISQEFTTLSKCATVWAAMSLLVGIGNVRYTPLPIKEKRSTSETNQKSNQFTWVLWDESQFGNPL